MSDHIDRQQPSTGQQPSAEELFYIEWARETKKRNIAVATDALQKLVTLNCALLGGSLVLYGKTILPSWIQPIVVVVFFLSLLSSVYGIIPQMREADSHDPADIREKKELTLKNKIWTLRIASFFLIVGFAVSILTIPFGALFTSTCLK